MVLIVTFHFYIYHTLNNYGLGHNSFQYLNFSLEPIILWAYFEVKKAQDIIKLPKKYYAGAKSE